MTKKQKKQTILNMPRLLKVMKTNNIKGRNIIIKIHHENEAKSRRTGIVPVIVGKV